MRIGCSFIVYKIPFIGYSATPIVPFIDYNLPFDRFRAHQRGFTMVELMITIVIAGVLLGIGVPNFNSFMKNNRMVSQANDLLADLTYARSEALKRSRNVHICKTSDPKITQPVCNATATDPWTSGWIIWSDNNNNGALDYVAVAPEVPDTLLRISEGLSGVSNTLTTTELAIQNQIVFTKLGILSNAGGTLNLCDDRGAGSGRILSITTAGRPAIGRNPTC